MTAPQPRYVDIFAAPGTTIVFSAAGGYDIEKTNAAKHLVIGSAYTLKASDISGFSTRFELEELPGKWFNSCLFSPDGWKAEGSPVAEVSTLS